MLFITRKPGETIVIDEQITVEIIDMAGGVVRLGIEAPPAVSIQRGEYWLPPKHHEEKIP